MTLSHRERAKPEAGRDRGERPVLVRERQVRPAVRGGARRQRPEERHLEQHVDHDPDEHRPGHRERNVPLRVAGLSAELDRLLEPEVGEHDAAGRDRAEDPLHAGGREPVAGGEVRAVERGHDQRHDREQGHRDLPPDHGPVRLAQPPHPPQVDHGEGGHQHRGDRVSGTAHEVGPQSGRSHGLGAEALPNPGAGRHDVRFKQPPSRDRPHGGNQGAGAGSRDPPRCGRAL